MKLTVAPEALKLSSDRKTAPFVVWHQAKRYWSPVARNAFGLPAIDTCPGSTEACREVCYAQKTPYPSMTALLQHNYALLSAASYDGMVALLEDLIAAYRVDHAKAERRSGRTLDKIFRIHWSGDFFSETYADAWGAVIATNPDIAFWGYTRSDFALKLDRLENCVMFASMDDSTDEAFRASATSAGVRVAYMGVPEHTDRRTLVCPAVGKSLTKGDRGYCAACTYCYQTGPTRVDVAFPIH